MVSNITLDTITKKFTQVIPEAKVCYICLSERYVDDHHYDFQHGKISPETVPLCRRCHATMGMYGGINMFDDDLLDKAIEVWNKTRSLLNRPLMTKDKIERSKYWLKKHGIKEVKGIDDNSGSQIPTFSFCLSRGEPLCGQQWVSDHLYDLMNYVPRIEVTGPGINLVSNINSIKELREVTKTLRGLKVDRQKKKVITYDPVNKRFSNGET